MPFRDRTDAGKQLAKALGRYRTQRPMQSALPRGGVIVAAEVAQSLRAPLDLVLVRKIGVPYQSELAMGAVVDGINPLVVRNNDVISASNIAEADFVAIKDRELQEIQRRRGVYLGARPHPVLAGRVVIVVDDGVATGATTRAALRAVRAQKPKQAILAVPVAPTSTLVELKNEADEIVCLEEHEPFFAIGAYYSDFTQISDEQVVETMARRPAVPSLTTVSA